MADESGPEEPVSINWAGPEHPSPRGIPFIFHRRDGVSLITSGTMTVGPTVRVNGRSAAVAPRVVSAGDSIRIVCDSDGIPVRISVNGD